MNKPLDSATSGDRAPRLTTQVVSEAVARSRFQQLLQEQHRLSGRKAKGRSLYQVICREDGQWLGLILWTGAIWHFKARDQWIGWDAVRRSERLQLVVHQARFLVLEQTRQPNPASQMLGAAVRDLPVQWEELYGYRPLLAETFTDPESHAGTCYKAADREPAGLSGKDGRHYAEKVPGERRPKKLWLKTLHPRSRLLFCAEELAQPYRAGRSAHAGERCALRGPQLDSLFDAFQKVPDPRRRCARRYPIGAVLGLIVTLVDAEEGVPVAVAANPAGKGHELKTTQALLASPQVSLANALVTADSLPCQDQTAHIITREKGGDYLLPIRDNQPTLHQHAQTQLAPAPPLFARLTPGTDGSNAAN